MHASRSNKHWLHWPVASELRSNDWEPGSRFRFIDWYLEISHQRFNKRSIQQPRYSNYPNREVSYKVAGPLGPTFRKDQNIRQGFESFFKRGNKTWRREINRRSSSVMRMGNTEYGSTADDNNWKESLSYPTRAAYVIIAENPVKQQLETLCLACQRTICSAY